jgi:hypothetical protein
VRDQVQQLRDFGLEGKSLFGHGSFWAVKTLKNQHFSVAGARAMGQIGTDLADSRGDEWRSSQPFQQLLRH